MEASYNGYKEIVELLIQQGADVNQKNNEGQNAMMVAYDNGTKKAIMDAVKKRNEKENGGSFFSKIKRRLGIDM
jgi:ankyrin repeat protein